MYTSRTSNTFATSSMEVTRITANANTETEGTTNASTNVSWKDTGVAEHATEGTSKHGAKDNSEDTSEDASQEKTVVNPICSHESCNDTFTRNSSAKRHRRNIDGFKAHRQCSNECRGCIENAGDRVRDRVKEKVAALKTIQQVQQLEQLVDSFNINEIPEPAPVPEPHNPWDATRLRSHVQRELKGIELPKAPERLAHHGHNALAIFPDFFQEILRTLIGNKAPASQQRLELVASIIGRSIDSNYVTPSCARLGVRMHGASMEDRFCMLQRLGVMPSYSFVYNILKELGSKVDQTWWQGVEFLEDGIGVLTFDNVQGDQKPTHAGLHWKKVVDVSTSTIARSICGGAKDLQREKETPQRETILKLAGFSVAREDAMAVEPSWSAGTTADTIHDIVPRSMVIAKTFFALPSQPLNPSSEENVRELLQGYRLLLRQTQKQWIFLGMDGSPYEIVRKLQLQDSAFDCFHIIPGPLHEEMNYLTCLAKLANAFGVLGVTCKIMRQTPENILTCKDTHKTIEVVTACFTALQESVSSFSSPSPYTPADRLKRMIVFAVDYFVAYKRFHDAIRTANFPDMLDARRKFYPLLFLFGHRIYAKIVADDTADLQRRSDDEIYMAARREATFVSVTSRDDLHQGCDALQEEINRMMSTIMGGNRDAAFWTKASVLFNQIAELKSEIEMELAMAKKSHSKRSEPSLRGDVAQIKEHIDSWFAETVSERTSPAPYGSVDPFTQQAMLFDSHARKEAESYITSNYSNARSPSAPRSFPTKLAWTNKTPRNAQALEDVPMTVLKELLRDFKVPASGSKISLKKRLSQVRKILAAGRAAEQRGEDLDTSSLLPTEAHVGGKRKFPCSDCKSELLLHVCPPLVWSAWQENHLLLTHKWGIV